MRSLPILPSLAFAILFLATFSGARNLHPGDTIMATATAAPAAKTLAEFDASRLRNCISAMIELRSFTDEIILFFLNGESYLSLECCRPIRVITHHCWPSMLTALGFTAEEGGILGGFCDADVVAPPPPAPAPAALLDDAFAAEGMP